MLLNLYIENILLIEKLTIDFNAVIYNYMSSDEFKVDLQTTALINTIPRFLNEDELFIKENDIMSLPAFKYSSDYLNYRKQYLGSLLVKIANSKKYYDAI